MKDQNKHIEVVDFTVSRQCLIFNYFNLRLKCHAEIILDDVQEVSDWVADNKLNVFLDDSEENGHHKQTERVIDPIIFVREELTAQEFIDYLREKGGLL